MGTSHEVTDDDTATALGSGDVDVLGTPRLLAWLEAATVEASLREEPSGGKLGFTVSARDGDGTVVGDGEIDRVVVEREGFGSS